VNNKVYSVYPEMIPADLIWLQYLRAGTEVTGWYLFTLCIGPFFRN